MFAVTTLPESFVIVVGARSLMLIPEGTVQSLFDSLKEIQNLTEVSSPGQGAVATAVVLLLWTLVNSSRATCNL